MLDGLNTVHRSLNRFESSIADFFESGLMLVFDRFYDFGDRAETLLKLVHETLLTVHARSFILLLALPQQEKSLVEPLSQVLL